MPTAPSDILRQKARGVSVGLFAAPLGRLDEAVRELTLWQAGIAHFDVMDGVFVPQITAGPAFVAALGTGVLRDVHLMVENPAAHVDSFADAGADLITVHAEAPGAKLALDAVRAASERLGRPILTGLAVMPSTPVESLAPLLAPVPDLLLVLALDPRDGKPADFTRANQRIAALREAVAPARPLMAIDGGVTLDTISAATEAGPDMVVSGSAIFRAPDPEAAYRSLAQAWSAKARPFATAETRNA